ncbi:beta-lactamase/transpeptidase-like protein [Penicillium taxi]|uniref:beta-lactamase/transpeptidase-like protein n=1 Tax=Penicillium taxi TaxID=168475 RepID=UPI002545BB49|nr:beta-lactamase/transpeptidase-like protein [Penicillium taxi]KAJ5893709.1 beta-lactamase/transpeptidase-like protein [Penicillium taxi]
MATPIQDILNLITLHYGGPGGAAAVIKDGELIAQRVWGHADMDQRIAMTPEIQMPICSITKQFMCALLQDLKRNPTAAMTAKGNTEEQFTESFNAVLDPQLTRDTGLTLDNLCDMQSGLRDYWAMTTLWGAKPDDEFLVHRDIRPMLERTKSFHFEPGTEYSYSNVNFTALGRIIERVTGETLGKLLSERVLDPAGMTTALLCPNNAELPPPCVGYEGNDQVGYFQALNRMEWSGDAGLVASLTDMISYEKYLDSLIYDPQSWYHSVAKPHTYNDGTPANYHYGLSRVDIDDVKTLGHGGALRGYRIHRRHAPGERLSVVVFFNHEADASAAVEDILRAILKKPNPEFPPVEPSPSWVGIFLDQETQLAITVSKGARMGDILISYSGGPETIKLTDPNNGKSRSMVATVAGDVLLVHRISENRILEARRLQPSKSSIKDTVLQGKYHSAEVDSIFHCTGEAGILYGFFDGYLGQGHAAPIRYLGDDVWALKCPRGLDAPAPGDWTMVLKRDDKGAVVSFVIGCWLARGVEFFRI